MGEVISFSEYLGRMLSHVGEMEEALHASGGGSTEGCLARLTCWLLPLEMLEALFYSEPFGWATSGRRVSALEEAWAAACGYSVYTVRSVVSGRWLHGEIRKDASEKLLSGRGSELGRGVLGRALAEADYWEMLGEGLPVMFPMLSAVASGVPWDDVFV